MDISAYSPWPWHRRQCLVSILIGLITLTCLCTPARFLVLCETYPQQMREQNSVMKMGFRLNSFGPEGSFSNGGPAANHGTLNDGFNSLELIDRVDEWPYYQDDAKKYRVFMEDYYYFMVDGYEKPFGYVHTSFVNAMSWLESWVLDHEQRLLTLAGNFSLEERSAAMQATLRHGHEDGKVECLRKWGNEMIPVISSEGEHVLDMDLCGVDIFGIVTSGVHLTAYVRTGEGLKYWVPRRAQMKTPFPGMLDNTVASNLASGQKPLDKLIRRAAEEASIPEEFTRNNAKACGTVSYQMTRTNDGKPGCQHHVQYVYEMELEPAMLPRPADKEVESFALMTVQEVSKELMRGEFNFRVMTWVAHFVRHGIVNAGNENHLAEVSARLHRRHDLFRP